MPEGGQLKLLAWHFNKKDWNTATVTPIFGVTRMALPAKYRTFQVF
jgi:hypothetical protein